MIADDVYLFREAVEVFLDVTGEIDVVGAVGDATSLLSAVERDRPGVVDADIRMPLSVPTRASHARVLHETHPEVGWSC